MNTIDINRFLVNALVLYSLKTPENQRTFGVFRGYEIEILASHIYIYIYIHTFNCQERGQETSK